VIILLTTNGTHTTLTGSGVSEFFTTPRACSIGIVCVQSSVHLVSYTSIIADCGSEVNRISEKSKEIDVGFIFVVCLGFYHSGSIVTEIIDSAPDHLEDFGFVGIGMSYVIITMLSHTNLTFGIFVAKEFD